MPDYVLEIKLKDQDLDRAIKKLQAAIGMGGSGGSSGNIFNKLQVAMNQLSKGFGGGAGGKLATLGLMSVGIMGIFDIMKKLAGIIVDSSPMLKAMMQLLNTGIMLMLRPIGDFIGFMLRPIMVYLLRYVMLPFYKYMAPFAQKYGTAIGEGILTIVELIAGAGAFLSDPVGAITKGFSSIDVTKIFKGFPDLSTLKLPDFSTLKDTIVNGITSIFTNIKLPDFSGIFKGLPDLKKAWDSLTGFFSMVGESVLNLLIKPLGQLNSFFGTIGTAIKNTLQPIWDALRGFFTVILKGMNNILLPVWSTLTDGFKTIANVFIGIYNGIRDWAASLPIIGGGIGKTFPHLKAMASGGMINEPVVGIGQRTGTGYLMGERGSEQVTPAGRGGGNTIIINVNGGDPIALKKIILETIQESNNRRRKV